MRKFILITKEVLDQYPDIKNEIVALFNIPRMELKSIWFDESQIDFKFDDINALPLYRRIYKKEDESYEYFHPLLQQIPRDHKLNQIGI